MSLAKTQAVINSLRARGITVHEWAGWQTRGNGQTSDYVGGIVHHTGSAYGSAYNTLVVGRPDLSGPLCNFAGNDDGSITVIAANPANHAGASGGRSMGPLPVTGSFNRRVMGLEIVYPGTSPMRPAQYHAANVWARVVADVCGGGNVDCIRAHAETSVTGKWDPGSGLSPGQTINMAAFRQASINPTQEVDVLQDERDALFRTKEILEVLNSGVPGGVTKLGSIAARNNEILEVLNAAYPGGVSSLANDIQFLRVQAGTSSGGINYDLIAQKVAALIGDGSLRITKAP